MLEDNKDLEKNKDLIELKDRVRMLTSILCSLVKRIHVEHMDAIYKQDFITCEDNICREMRLLISNYSPDNFSDLIFYQL